MFIHHSEKLLINGYFLPLNVSVSCSLLYDGSNSKILKESSRFDSNAASCKYVAKTPLLISTRCYCSSTHHTIDNEEENYP